MISNCDDDDDDDDCSALAELSSENDAGADLSHRSAAAMKIALTEIAALLCFKRTNVNIPAMPMRGTVVSQHMQWTGF